MYENTRFQNKDYSKIKIFTVGNGITIIKGGNGINKIEKLNLIIFKHLTCVKRMSIRIFKFIKFLLILHQNNTKVFVTEL